MKILLVEDEGATAALIRGMITAMGHEVVLAIDGRQALRMLDDEPSSIVVSDWMMPGLDGPSLCRQIRGRGESGSYTYIILTTVRRGRADRMEGLRAGADDFLIKPVNYEELAVRLEIARRILAVQERLEIQNARLAELASIDELTGLMNRREFRRTLEANLALASRNNQNLSLILIDVDHFKNYNDDFGHPAGDAALRAFAETVRASFRDHEPVARHGGEEFAVILFGTGPESARGSAERIRANLARREWIHRPITASLGIATTGSGTMGVEALIQRADLALYHSKHLGRDRVTHFDNGEVALRFAVTEGSLLGTDKIVR